MSDQIITSPPDATGLYDPADERDACGVGFVVNIKGHRSHLVVQQGLQVLDRKSTRLNSSHRL